MALSLFLSLFLFLSLSLILTLSSKNLTRKPLQNQLLFPWSFLIETVDNQLLLFDQSIASGWLDCWRAESNDWIGLVGGMVGFIVSIDSMVALDKFRVSPGSDQCNQHGNAIVEILAVFCLFVHSHRGPLNPIFELLWPGSLLWG